MTTLSNNQFLKEICHVKLFQRHRCKAALPAPPAGDILTISREDSYFLSCACVMYVHVYWRLKVGVMCLLFLPYLLKQSLS